MIQKMWTFPLILLLVVSIVLAGCQPAAPAGPEPTNPPAEPTSPPSPAPTTALEAGIVSSTPTTPPDSGGPKQGGKLTMALASVSHLDCNSIDQDNEVYPLVYETLFELNEKWQPVGLLVKEVEISDDGLVHTWKLQEGVTFHDGTEFNADVVKWNLERKIELQQPLYTVLNWDSLEVVDPLTLRVTFSHPNFALYAYLSSTTFSMYSPTFVENSTPDDLKNQVVGTGPFIITEYLPNENIKLVRNENYWREGQPYLDEIEVKIVKDANTRLMMLQSGEVQWLKDISFVDIARLEADTSSDIGISIAPSTRFYYITLHNQRPPLDNPLVRQAFNYAIDKEGMNASIFNGLLTISTDVVTSYVNGYSQKDYYPYDPEKAKQLLDEAGLIDTNGDGFREFEGQEKEFIINTRKGQRPGDIEIVEQVHAMLRQVGINVKVEVMDSATFFTYLNQTMDKAPYYDMSNQSPANNTGDAQYQLDTMYSCDAWPGTYYNYSHYCNEEVEALLQAAREAPTLEERNELYAQATAIIWEDAPGIYLFDGINSLGSVKNLKGVYSDGAHQIWNVKYAWFE